MDYEPNKCNYCGKYEYDPCNKDKVNSCENKELAIFNMKVNDSILERRFKEMELLNLLDLDELNKLLKRYKNKPELKVVYGTGLFRETLPEKYRYTSKKENV